MNFVFPSFYSCGISLSFLSFFHINFHRFKVKYVLSFHISSFLFLLSKSSIFNDRFLHDFTSLCSHVACQISYLYYSSFICILFYVLNSFRFVAAMFSFSCCIIITYSFNELFSLSLSLSLSFTLRYSSF
jgi:hypothetical protein